MIIFGIIVTLIQVLTNIFERTVQNMEEYSKYKEINDRPDNIFPFYPYKIYGKKGLCVPPHWHDEIEILYAQTAGTLVLDGEKIRFSKNDIMFVNSKQLHSTYLDTGGLVYHIIIHPTLLHIYYSGNDKNYNLHFPAVLSKNNTDFQEIMRELADISMPVSKTTQLFIMSRIFQLMFLIQRDGYNITSEDSSPAAGRRYIKNSITYIHKNISRKIRVEEIAGNIGISKAYFMRLFKNYTGETVVSYIQNLRLEAAKTDILNGRNITETAYNYDFSDPAYFCRLFKKKYGLSPLKYKNTFAPKDKSRLN